MPAWFSRSIAGLVCAFLLGLIGCSGQKAVYPVSGQVVSGEAKKPAVGALVMLVPVTADPKDSTRPSGTVDESGAFAITTYKAKDGAPAGDYVVTLVWPTPKKSMMEEGEDDMLKGAFADATKSKIRFTVKAAKSNEVPVIELP
jgi:hypothetical protein